MVTAPKPRAWQYMGAGQDYEHDPDTAIRVWVDPGDLYIAAEPLTADDIELAPRVEVTAEDLLESLPESDGETKGWAREYARNLNERLATRWEELDRWQRTSAGRGEHRGPLP